MPGNDTILLDTQAWDLILDVDGNIAKATEPYSLAQDAASAIKTFHGEVYFDTTIGVPYLTEILGQTPAVQLTKAEFVAAAETVAGVSTAKAFITSIEARGLSGQVQVKSAATGAVAAANFVVVNPQGAG